MEQGCGMNILKKGREPVKIFSFVRAELRGKHKEKRPDPFPCPQQRITNNVRDHGDTGTERPIQSVVDFFEVRAEAI
jgi:hypothetical protein